MSLAWLWGQSFIRVVAGQAGIEFDLVDTYEHVVMTKIPEYIIPSQQGSRFQEKGPALVN